MGFKVEQYSEKIGEFYLGKVVDPITKKTTDQLLRYDSKDLTTHAVIVGMTGSGKTGLALALIEEAGLDKIPAILIDPKGDLGDLLLTFPNLSSEEFSLGSRKERRKEMVQTLKIMRKQLPKSGKQDLLNGAKALNGSKSFESVSNLLFTLLQVKPASPFLF